MFVSEEEVNVAVSTIQAFRRAHATSPSHANKVTHANYFAGTYRQDATSNMPV